MSDTYLSWKTEGGLVDAGRVTAWSAVAAWVRKLPAQGSIQLAKLLRGQEASAARLEPELARAFAQTLRTGPVDDDLWQGLVELTYAVIARRPGLDSLVVEESDSEEYEEPQLLAWVCEDEAAWSKWPAKQLQRVRLLLEIEPLLLDTSPDDDDARERQLLLAVYLDLLPQFAAVEPAKV